MRTFGKICGLLCLFTFCWPIASSSAQAAEKEGKLVVIVAQGEDNSAARDSFVYIRGYQPKYLGEVSFTPKAIRAGWYEASLPPGLYDVLVSEGSSLPRCKRVEIKAAESKFWSLRLEVDDEHMQH